MESREGQQERNVALYRPQDEVVQVNIDVIALGVLESFHTVQLLPQDVKINAAVFMEVLVTVVKHWIDGVAVRFPVEFCSPSRSAQSKCDYLMIFTII